MDRLILVLLLLAGGWFLVDRLDLGLDFSASRTAVSADGRAVVVAPMLKRQNLVLAEQVEIPDCETLLR